METIIFVILGLIALIISLTFHEFSHALVAYYFGDETAKRAGRLTLNPIPHIDPIGTLLIPLVAALSSVPLLGWAKPVPVNPYNLRPAKWADLAVSLAGPFSNVFLAVVFGFVLKFALMAGLAEGNLLVSLLFSLVMINVVLAVFNLLPLPPLDGAKLVTILFDDPKYQRTIRWLEVNGYYVLLGLIIFAQPLLGKLVGGAASVLFKVVGLS